MAQIVCYSELSLYTCSYMFIYMYTCMYMHFFDYNYTETTKLLTIYKHKWTMPSCWPQYCHRIVSVDMSNLGNLNEGADGSVGLVLSTTLAFGITLHLNQNTYTRTHVHIYYHTHTLVHEPITVILKVNTLVEWCLPYSTHSNTAVSAINPISSIA